MSLEETSASIRSCVSHSRVCLDIVSRDCTTIGIYNGRSGKNCLKRSIARSM